MVIRAFLKNNKILQNKIFTDKKKKKKENQKIKKKSKKAIMFHIMLSFRLDQVQKEHVEN